MECKTYQEIHVLLLIKFRLRSRPIGMIPEFIKFEKKDRELFLTRFKKSGKNSLVIGLKSSSILRLLLTEKEILERLQAERTIHNHYKNLIVAALQGPEKR